MCVLQDHAWALTLGKDSLPGCTAPISRYFCHPGENLLKRLPFVPMKVVPPSGWGVPQLDEYRSVRQVLRPSLGFDKLEALFDLA
jgi:hypothetical protein